MEQEEVWDAIAGKWSEFRIRPTEEVLEFLDGKKGKVLDLGCGSGRHGSLKDMGNGQWAMGQLEFYGVDFSEELLKLAREKDYIEVKKGYTYDIPYSDGFFDYVVFSRVLHCVDSAERRRKSLEEIARVLKVGGEALISTWGEKGCKRLKSGEKEGFSSWTVGDKKVKRYTYVYDKDELIAELESVGFEILKIEVGKNIVVVVRKPLGSTL